MDSSWGPDDLGWKPAEAARRAVVTAMGSGNGGAFRAPLLPSHPPAGHAPVDRFLTNCAERQRLLDPAYQERIARGMSKRVSEFLSLSH